MIPGCRAVTMLSLCTCGYRLNPVGCNLLGYDNIYIYIHPVMLYLHSTSTNFSILQLVISNVYYKS